MKAIIEITGQISGNFKLRNAITCYDIRQGMFNSFNCYFDTKKEARKALREAYKYMKSEDKEVTLYNDCLSYDASKAKLYNDKV